MADEIATDGNSSIGNSKGIHACGVPGRFRKRTPDIDTNDEFYEHYPERLEQDLKDAHIPFLQHLKHYPWHNADYTVWLDREFGDGRAGYVFQDPSTIRADLEPILDTIPELTQWIRIRGKSHIRHIGICTQGKMNEVKLLLANSSRVEPMMDKEAKFWVTKDVRASVNKILSEEE